MNLRTSDRAVASVMGTVLTTAIVVGLVSVVAFVMLNQPRPVDPISASVEPQVVPLALLMHHSGGEPIPAGEGRFQLTVDGEIRNVPLTDHLGDISAGNPSHWEIGEEVCISCPTFDAHITEVVVIARDRVLLVYDGGWPLGMGPNGTGGIFDPGFAYDDVNCNGRYNDPLDEQVSAEVQAGNYTTPNCLVIPPSESDIRLSGAGSNDVFYQADAIYIAPDVTVDGADGNVRMIADRGCIIVEDGATITADGAGGDVHLRAEECIRIGKNVGITTNGQSGNEVIHAGTFVTVGRDSVFRVNGIGGAFPILAEEGQISADDMTFTGAGGALVELTADGNVIVDRTTFHISGSSGMIVLDATSTAHEVHLDGASFDDGDDVAQVEPPGVTVIGTPASGGWSY